MSKVINMVGGGGEVNLKSISVSKMPTKTSYYVGDMFDPAGMVVIVEYNNGKSATIGGYYFSPNGALGVGDDTITISYTEAGVTASTTIPITVTKRYDEVFENNTWEKIIDACHRADIPKTWAVGNSKDMDIGGTTYKIQIIGKNHDVYESGDVAPLTFQMLDCFNTVYAMHSSATNAGGWADSAMRTERVPSILSLMPSAVREGIQSVTKLTYVGGTTNAIVPTVDKGFLLSEVEVFGSLNYSSAGEGTQYAYYAAGNSAIKKTNGTAGYWWLRSPRANNTTAFCRVNASGSYAQSSATTECGVSVAFCF